MISTRGNRIKCWKGGFRKGSGEGSMFTLETTRTMRCNFCNPTLLRYCEFQYLEEPRNPRGPQDDILEPLPRGDNQLLRESAVGSQFYLRGKEQTHHERKSTLTTTCSWPGLSQYFWNFVYHSIYFPFSRRRAPSSPKEHLNGGLDHSRDNPHYRCCLVPFLSRM